MNKPTQSDIDTAREVLEYSIAYMNEHEPYAVNTIASFEATLGAMPNEDEFTEELS